MTPRSRRRVAGLKDPETAPSPRGRDARLYTLEVSLLSGPVLEPFARANPVVSRTIEIRGDQTLERLHYAIFEAFDREEEHLYEFQLGGRRPMDPRARRYGRATPDFGWGEREPVRSAARTRLDTLGLKVRDRFAYWFDFGDDWWHQVSVVAIVEQSPAGRYPRVTQRVGESPPQYADWEQE